MKPSYMWQKQSKICQECGRAYEGNGSSKYCPFCRDAVIERNRIGGSKNAKN
jgi:rubrerythrin